MELAVHNLAVIEDVRVELQPGFCAWTGETGAGKSLLLGALGLLLGERGSAELIRTGADELRVTGRFELARLEQKTASEAILNSPLLDDELVLSRRLFRNGRSVSHVNEQPIALTTLRKLGEILVDVHGQRESYSLLQPAYQLDVLDSFGKLTDHRQLWQQKAEQVRGLRQQHRCLLEQRQARLRELALIRFEREELDTADLHENEWETLSHEREKLLHAQSLSAFTSNVSARLYDDEGSVVETLGKLIKEANHWSGLDRKLSEVSQRLEAIRPEVQDLAETCRDLSEHFEANPERLDAIEQRLQFLRKLEAKYGRSLPNLIEYHATLDQKHTLLQKQEEDLSGIEKQLLPLHRELKRISEKLSKQRAQIAKTLVAEAQTHLADLQMAQAKLDAVFTTTPLSDDPLAGEIPLQGIDHLEIQLSANPGEPARPLRKVASGGELSRTMLALKTVLAAHDPVRTLVVFDEIDANVGGRLGDVLGQKLAQLGKSHQVLCVTHLPQVASYAQHQWTIRKRTSGKRTATTITFLESEESRVEELALMLRGESRSETTRREAREMLTAAQR